MTVIEILASSIHYQQAMQLRFEVFFKDFGFDISITPDELEPVSRHFGIIKHNIVIAYGRLSKLPDSNIYRLSQIVVHNEHRSSGYSLIILKKLIDEAALESASKLTLSAQVTAKGLYEKVGFKAVDKPYVVKLTGVEHQKMELIL